MRIESVIASTKYEPRPYQREIIRESVDRFRGRYKNLAGQLQVNNRSLFVESPCGSGKTCMGLCTAKTLQHEIPELVVGWVAMRRNLLKQARAEHEEKQVGLKNIHFVSMFEHYPEELVAARAAGKPIMLVVDEGHHDSTNSMAHLHNIIKPDMSLGLSATPYRCDRVKLVFESTIRRAGIHSLIQDGYLSKYDHYTIDKWDINNLVSRYAADPERWGKSVFYFHTTDECFALKNELEKHGFLSEVVTHESDRDEQLEKFKKNEVDILINCMVLTEGFDCPALKTAWVRDSGRGTTIQMGGRAFRKFPTLPVKQIVQSKMTRWPFVKTAMPEQQYLWMGDGWRSLKVNPFIEDITNAAQQAIATIDVQLPAFITKHRKKKKLKVV